MVNNEDIYVTVSEPTEYCNHSLLVEWWLSVEGKALKEIIVWSCKILCQVQSKWPQFNYINMIIILLWSYYWGPK